MFGKNLKLAELCYYAARNPIQVTVVPVGWMAYVGKETHVK